MVSSSEDDADEAPGFMDLVAAGEERLDDILGAIHGVTSCLDSLTAETQAATEKIHENDSRSGGMRGRLAISVGYASAVDNIAARLEDVVSQYEGAMEVVSGGNLALISAMENDPSQAQTAEAINYGIALRNLAASTRGALQSLSGMIESMKENARLTRVLRAPTRRVLNAMSRYSDAAQKVDEWDRRLQALGIAPPPA